LPFAAFFLGRKRFFSTFFVTAIALLVISAIVTGWSGLLTYPRYVWTAERNTQFAWNNSDSNTPNVRGLLSIMLPLGTAPKFIVLTFASGLVLYLCWLATRRSGPISPLTFAIATVTAELVSFHAFVHDLSVLYIPILVALERLMSAPELPPLTRKTLSVCLLIFFCSPVYMVLMLR